MSKFMKHIEPAKQNNPVISLNGPDGCGKTTIGERVVERLVSEGDDTLFLGSSDFREWLTPEICEEFTGTVSALEEGSSHDATPDQKVNLYEALPACLFGLANRHAATKGPVVVHSDPYVKRLVWARTELQDGEFENYIAQLDGLVDGQIGDTYATHTSIIVSDYRDNYKRILSRGLVSDYDPVTIEDNAEIQRSLNNVLSLLLAEPRVLERFASVKVQYIENPYLDEGELWDGIDSIARQIIEFTKGS